MTTPSEIKVRILHDIAAHVKVYGRTNWDAIREHPDYAALIGKETGSAGERKFFRWVKQVCEPVDSDLGRPKSEVEVTANILNAATHEARVAAMKHVPAAPSPAYIMREGSKAHQNIDFLAAVNTIWADAELLREFAMMPDPATGGQRIKNPSLFDNSIRRRIDVMESALKVMQEIWDLQYQQRFYDAIVDLIVEELGSVPDIQRRVIERLAELNNRRGMTIYAEPR